MIWATGSSRSCFCWLYRASLSLAAKNIFYLFSVLPIWWCPYVESSLMGKRVFALTSAFSWQNSVSICPASFCTSRPNLPITPSFPWLPTFAFQSPMMKRTSFLVLVLEGLHRTIQLLLLQDYWLGHRLGLLWYWIVCLGSKQRSLCHFWYCNQVLHFRLFYWLWGLLHFFHGILAHSRRYNGRLN